jgi:hypothetical protein
MKSQTVSPSPLVGKGWDKREKRFFNPLNPPLHRGTLISHSSIERLGEQK